MRQIFKRVGVLIGSLALACGVLVGIAGTASAAPKWVSDPAACTGTKTLEEYSSSTVVVQVRSGRCHGTTYVWARANNNFTIYLDLYNAYGHRVGTNATQNGSGATHYTKGRRIQLAWKYRAVAQKGSASYEVSWTND